VQSEDNPLALLGELGVYGNKQRDEDEEFLLKYTDAN